MTSNFQHFSKIDSSKPYSMIIMIIIFLGLTWIWMIGKCVKPGLLSGIGAAESNEDLSVVKVNCKVIWNGSNYS